VDRNDPTYKKDPAYRDDNVVDPTAPGYTPVDGSGTAPENEESGNEALGAGAGALIGRAIDDGDIVCH